MLFGKRKKKKQEEINVSVKNPYVSVSELYLKYANKYIEYQGKLMHIENPINNSEFYQEQAGPYYKAVMFIVNYMENKFPDSILEEDNVLNVDIEELEKDMDDNCKTLFYPPNFPNLIYIKERMCSTHLHTNGQVVVDAESIESLPGLSDILASEKINKLFIGLTPIEVKALLQQMNIYPDNTELDLVINDYHEREFINQGFLKSVICLLLIRRTKYDLKRARLFADSLGVSFDFTYFEKEDIRRKKFEN